MNGLVSVLVDEGLGAGRAVTTTIQNFSSLAEAQQESGRLGSVWAAEGWTKRHEVWVKGDAWRQKMIVVGGVGEGPKEGRR